MNTVHIVHLYPKEMNIYGDNGNLLVLKKRLEWRNIPVHIHKVGIGDTLPKEVHFVLGGGGQDKGQSDIATDLKKKASSLKLLAKKGVPMLMICGMYQMFGHYFQTFEGEKIPGIGILDVYTVASTGRLIGNIQVKTDTYGSLVGYENHSGRTFLREGVAPLGGTKKGQGNNGNDAQEGAVHNNVFGSYLHGPVLAKSPLFADYLLQLAMEQAGNSIVLSPLDDKITDQAIQVAVTRPR